MADLETKVREVLEHIDPNCSYKNWTRIAMGVKHELGEAGFNAFDEWSSGAKKGYSALKTRLKFRNVKAFGGVTFATVVALAKEEGYVPKRGAYKKPTPEVLAARKAKQAALEAQYQKEKAEAAVAARERANKRWAQLDGKEAPESHPYLKKKGIKPHGVRVGKWKKVDEETGELLDIDNVLIIPMMDRGRNIHSLQGITVEGEKLFMYGGAKKGHFYAIGTPKKNEAGAPVFVFAEGFATGASVHEATGHMVFCCFDLGNMLEVARIVRAAAPAADLIIAADNDTKTNGNPGLTSATALGIELGARVAVPEPGDFNDMALAMGQEAVQSAFAHAVVPAEPFEAASEAPAASVVPAALEREPQKVVQLYGGQSDRTSPYFEVLGFDGDNYYIYHRKKKQVITRTAKGLTKSGLFELAEREFWELNFTATREGGAKFDEVVANQHIYDLAHLRGVYDPNNVRGRGLWIDKKRIVFNHGNSLTVDGVSMDVDKIDSVHVYPQAKPMPPLAPEMLSAEEGRNLYKIAQMMRWVRPGSAALLCGWLFLAPVCGALSWRPHVWLTGPAGSGKSYIQNHFINRLLAGIAETYDGGTSTEAGIRQQLESDAMPVTIDEFEPNQDVSRAKIEQVLSLIRQSSSESMAITAKGTPGGSGQTFHIRSMFLMSSINALLNKDSDSSRITQIALKPPAQDGDEDDQWDKLQDELHSLEKQGDLPSRLLTRGLAMAPLVREHTHTFTALAAKKFKTQRHGDQFGTLLCGAWFMCSDVPPSNGQAQAFLDKFDWQEHQEARPSDQDATLEAIKTKQVRVDTSAGNITVSVYELVRDAYFEMTVPSHTTKYGEKVAVDALMRNGIRVFHWQSKYWLAFLPQHPLLQKMVEKLPAFSDLRATLKRLQDATTFDNRSVRFLGAIGKAVGIPMEAVLGEEEGGPL